MRKRVILAARTGSDDPNASARGHVESQEAVDLVERLARSLRAEGRLEVAVVPHVLDVTEQIL